MLALKLLATYAYLPVTGSSAIQHAAVPPSFTCELIGSRLPLLAIVNDETAPLPPAGMLVADPKSSVTSRCPPLTKVRPKKLGSAGNEACVVVGLPALPFSPTGKT